jgi:hypothetical protein
MRCVPCLNAAQRGELEDFALDAARTLIDNRNRQALFTHMLEIWAEVGVDPVALIDSLRRERDVLTRHMPAKRRLGPVQGFVIPTLRRCGLLSERVAARYHEFLRENLSGNLVGETVEEFLQRIPDLPEDTAAWVLGEIQSTASVDDVRLAQGKRCDCRVEPLSTGGDHLICAVHGAKRGAERAARRVVEGLPRREHGLLADHARSPDLLDLAIAIGDDPVTGDQLCGLGAEVRDLDGVEEEPLVILR